MISGDQAYEPPRLTRGPSADDHAQGPAAASVTLVEYGDYECPSCGAAYPIVKQLQSEFGDRLRFVFRNFPLTDVHPYALDAALAAEAAGPPGHFWQMHDLLFEHQQTLATADLESFAGQLGLEPGSVVRPAAERFAGRVEQDFSEGVRSGVNGTPTFYINGARHDGHYDLDTLREALQATL